MPLHTDDRSNSTGTTPRAGTTGASSGTIARATRRLLACGVAGGPVYVAVVLLQALVRDGFDPTRHAASLLSNGDLGWIQVTNFEVTGALSIAGAAGMRRVLHPGKGGTWGPLLVGAYGLGLLAAGAFRADPADGFPPGTPPGMPRTVSWHSTLHFSVAGLAFLALVAACFVVARRFAAAGLRGWAAYSATTGVLFFAAFAGIATGSGARWATVAVGIAVVLGWGWLSATSARLTKGALR